MFLRKGMFAPEAAWTRLITGPGTVRLIANAMRSPGNTIWMLAMRMVFHVTNRQMLTGIRPGDITEFEAARLRGAVMIVGLRKAS